MPVHHVDRALEALAQRKRTGGLGEVRVAYDDGMELVAGDEAAVAAAIYDHLTLTGPYRECLIEQDAEDEKARRSQEDSL